MTTQTSPTPEKKSLVRKLAEVMGEVERVAKSGRNEFHRYDYATEADIVASVRGAMAARHLMLVPDVEDIQWGKVERKNGSPDRLATLRVRFTVLDGDSGESHSFTVLGEGQDPGDKATYKALTGATKYALLKLFLIPTGDDPENDAASSPPPRRQAPQQAPRTAAAPSAAHPETARVAAKADAQAKVDKALGREEALVAFGVLKGRPIASLSSNELATTIHFGLAKLSGNPTGKWVATFRSNLEALRTEEQRRLAEYQAAHPLTGEFDVPAEPGAQG